MPARRRSARSATAALCLVAAATTVAAAHPSREAPVPAAVRPLGLAGVYRMEAPERVRPAPRLRMPITEVTFLRLFADGRSRLENVAVSDRGGAVTAETEVGTTHRHPWTVETPAPSGVPAAALAKLCFETAGTVVCQRYERDEVTGDLALFADATAGSVTLRLERVRDRPRAPTSR